jgi:hypothetical protein
MVKFKAIFGGGQTDGHFKIISSYFEYELKNILLMEIFCLRNILISENKIP